MEQTGKKQLLTRPEFKRLGFLLTAGKCCVPGCSEDAVDAHHIMDRKLFSNGGYYLSNCAPVCEKHHLQCEKSEITPAELLEWLGIKDKDLVRPDKLDWIDECEYPFFVMEGLVDKWGK